MIWIQNRKRQLRRENQRIHHQPQTKRVLYQAKNGGIGNDNFYRHFTPIIDIYSFLLEM